MDEEDIADLLSDLGKPLDDYSSSELKRIEEFLLADKRHRARAAVLSITLHFTPQQALEKERGVKNAAGPYDNELEPYQMIRKNLRENYGFDMGTANEIGTKLGQILRDWFEDDRFISNEAVIKSKLKNNQNNQCANCNVRLDNEDKAVSFQNVDRFKPLHQFKRNQTTAELDHVEPLSRFGGNTPSNFQVLCRFCNQGKGKAKYIPSIKQLKKSVQPIQEIDPGYRREIFYAATANTEACTECGSKTVELTIRQKQRAGCYVVSNLKAVCVDCAYE